MSADLSRLPKSHQRKARNILAALERGEPWATYRGKRLRHDRTVVTIPLGRRWRMILRDTGDGLEFVEACSHERYSRGAKPG